MSIPWPGCSHHQLVQVTSVFATFLSPFALAVLANTTNSLVRHLCHTAEPHQQCCNLSRTYSSESRQKAASEPDLVSEQEAVLQDSCQRIRHCSGVPETVLAPIEYCTCYLSDIEEGGDFLPIRQMESSGSQKPAGDEVQAGSINNCTKPSGHGGSQQVLGKNNSQTTDSNCSVEWNNNLAKTRMVGRIGEEASFKTKQEMVKSIRLQKSSKSPCDIGEHELHAPDDSELQVKSKSEKETAYQNTNLAPTSKVNNSFPDLKKVTTDGMPDGDSTTISSQECSKNEQRCQAKVVPEQSVKEAHRKCNATDDAAGGKNNTVPPKETLATGAKNTDKRKQTLNSKKTKGVKDSSVDVESRQDGQKREKSPETRGRSPKIAHKKTTEEKPPASRKIVSQSSSRESFSTACCSSTSSSSYQLDSEKEDGPKPQSKDHHHLEDDSLVVKEICTRPASKEASSDAQPNPSPLFALATPPFSTFPDHRNAISKQTFCIKHGAQDYDHSSSEYDTKMDTNFSGWFKSVLKAWLPFAGQKTQNSSSRRRNNYFHEYDIRNILNPRLEGLWATRQAPVTSSEQPYPHSCASSLCNFRLTLESWKKELQEMHDALEESSNAVPENPCTFCHKDHHCQGFTSCRTMQLAQKFWSTIVDLKRSHLQSCECPHLNQKFEKPNLDSSCDEADQSRSWNSCRNDFSGCSQLRNSFLTGDVREAPCVHVLLDELDLLQKNLKRLTRTKVNTKSQVCQTDQAFRLNEQTVGDQDEVPKIAKKQLQEGDGRTSAQAYLSDAVPGRHDSVRRSHRSTVNSASGKPVQDGHGSQKRERSNTSKLLPSASLSLTEEMGELDELSDFFLGQRKRSTGHQNSGNLTECQNMIPEYLGSLTRVGSAHKSVKPSDVIPQTTSLPQLVNSENPQLISNTHKASRQHSDQEQDNSDTQAVNKTRNLGKFAFQYLGHIENTLDNQAATSPSVSTSSTAPACDGDTPKPVRRNSLSRADSTSQSDSSKISQFSQITADSESEKPSSYGTAEGSVAEISSESSQCATVKEQGVGSLLCGQKDSTLKTAFDSIIADLIQFQQNQCRDKIDKRTDTPPDKSPKNVKFSPSSTQKTDSMTNVSSLGDISPPLHGLVPSDSSSNEDCLKDVNVTEAFDQLDKIVDELLHLMESRPEPCVK